MKAGIIGLGTIGGCLFSELVEQGFDVVGVTQEGVFNYKKERIDGKENWLSYFSKADIICICIPTQDEGAAAFDYIRTFLIEMGKPVVTSEKGALGNYYPELNIWLSKIGFRATVGGKTGMALELRNRISHNTRSIYAVLNATLNFIFSRVAAGESFDEAVEKAVILGFAEPGAKSLTDVIRGEIKDTLLKTAILFNAGIGGYFGSFIRARDIKLRQAEEGDWNRLFREAGERRYVVSIIKDNVLPNDIIGGFSHNVGEWNIAGGFWKKEKCPLFQLINPVDEDNALAIFDSARKGKIGLIGEGAGPGPTVSAMLQDVKELLNLPFR
jgi:homoserine dehydrogenase